MELNEADLWAALEESSPQPLSVSPGELRTAVTLLLAVEAAGGPGGVVAGDLARRWGRRIPASTVLSARTEHVTELRDALRQAASWLAYSAGREAVDDPEAAEQLIAVAAKMKSILGRTAPE